MKAVILILSTRGSQLGKNNKSMTYIATVESHEAKNVKPTLICKQEWESSGPKQCAPWNKAIRAHPQVPCFSQVRKLYLVSLKSVACAQAKAKPLAALHMLHLCCRATASVHADSLVACESIGLIMIQVVAS